MGGTQYVLHQSGQLIYNSRSMNKISPLHAPSSWFSYSHTPAPTPLGLAVHLGLLSGDSAGEATAIRAMRQGRQLSDEERHGEYALAHSFRQGSIMPPAWARARGADTRVIGLTWTDESQMILTMPGSGITTSRDLRGRRFALASGRREPFDHFRAASLRGLLTVLSLEGLTHQDVEIVEVEANPRKVFEAEATALLHGVADFIYVRGIAGVQLARSLGLYTVIDLRHHPDPRIRNNGCTLRAFTANTQVLRQFPDVGRCFLTLANDAARWARLNPGGVFSYAASEAKVDDELVRAAYGDALPLNLNLSLEDGQIDALRSFTTFLAQWNLIERPIDVDAWIDPEPLHSILYSERRTA